MSTMQFFILIGASMQHFDAERSDDVYPRNLAVTVGHPIQFFCGASSDKEVVIWKVKKIGKLNEEPISNVSYVTKIYRADNFMIVQSRSGSSQLTKDRAELDDAGTYKCIRTSRDESVIGIGSAQLIVFSSKPECYANAAVTQEGECLHISCNINYIGSLNPVIECSEIDGIRSRYLTDFSGSDNLTVFNKYVSSTDNGRNLSCATYFEPLMSIDYRTDAQKADNAPEFEHKWNHQFNVEFRPKSVAIHPRKNVFMNGEVIRCTADGNPIPLYTWREIGSNDVASFNSTLVVNEKTMHGRAYECMATNTRGSLSTSITIRVSESNSNHDSSLIHVVTIVAGILCAVLLVAVIAMAFKRIAGCPIHHLNVHTEETPTTNLGTVYKGFGVDQHDEAVLQDVTELKDDESDFSPYPSSIPETSGAYSQLGNRPAITLVPPVYESLEDYELIPEVSDLQIDNAEEHELCGIQKDANAKLDPSKVLYVNVGRIPLVEDYINVGRILKEEEE